MREGERELREGGRERWREGGREKGGRSKAVKRFTRRIGRVDEGG